MSHFRCDGCQGEYEDVGPLGDSYAHVCPPILELAITRAGAALFVPLAELRPTDTITVLRAGQALAITADALQAGDIRQGDRFTPRPPAQHRDENPPLARVRQADRPDPARAIRAEGAGRTRLDHTPSRHV